MRFAEQDIRTDKPRPLSECGDQPGRDARWRDYPWEGGNSVAVREVQRIAEDERRAAR